MNKRSGFTTRFLRRQRNAERFDMVFGTFPNRLYVLTDTTGQYAITGEEDSDYVVMKKVDKTNKYQWVLVDADTGTICFFTDLKNYMSITVIDAQINVKRSDILKNGTFTFNSDFTITLKNYPDYCLAFKKSGLQLSSAAADSDTEEADADAIGTEETAPAAGATGTTAGTTGGTAPAAGATGTTGGTTAGTATGTTEGFFSRRYYEHFTNRRWRRERFDAAVDIPLEVVKVKDLDLNTYSNVWKFDLVYDLRELTDNADTIEELKSANSSGDTQIASLQKLVENNKKQFDTELEYKDAKIKEYTDKINRYESNWFVSWFLKE